MKTITAALLALLIFATAASADQFYIEKPGTKHGERVRLKPGTVKVESIAGKWILRLKEPGKGTSLVKVECTDVRTDNLSNTETEAHDEIVSVSFACPEGVTVTPITPWFGELQGAGEPFTEPTSMALEVTTPGHEWGFFSGTINATFGDADPIPRDDIDPHFKTTATGSGVLTSLTSGATLGFVINDFYGTKFVDRADGERNGEPEENNGGEEGGE